MMPTNSEILQEVRAHRDRLLAEVRLLRKALAEADRQIAELQAENEGLNAWEQSAMSIITEWDKVYEALGKPGRLGQSMPEQALIRVGELQARVVELERDALQQRCERLEKALRKLDCVAGMIPHRELDGYCAYCKANKEIRDAALSDVEAQKRADSDLAGKEKTNA